MICAAGGAALGLPECRPASSSAGIASAVSVVVDGAGGSGHLRSRLQQQQQEVQEVQLAVQSLLQQEDHLAWWSWSIQPGGAVASGASEVGLLQRRGGGVLLGGLSFVQLQRRSSSCGNHCPCLIDGRRRSRIVLEEEEGACEGLLGEVLVRRSGVAAASGAPKTGGEEEEGQ